MDLGGAWKAPLLGVPGLRVERGWGRCCHLAVEVGGAAARVVLRRERPCREPRGRASGLPGRLAARAIPDDPDGAGLEVDLHLGVDQATAQAEHTVAEDG